MRYRVPYITLTSLLDLLVIVLFAQHLRVKQVARQADASVQADLRASRQQADRALDRLAEAQAAQRAAEERVLDLARRTAAALDLPQDALTQALDELNADMRAAVLQLLDELQDDDAARVVRRLQQMAAVGKYVSFWHVVLGDEDTVGVEFSPGLRTELSFTARDGAHIPAAIASELGASVVRTVGEPAKGLVLITYGYTGRSTAFAWRALQQGVVAWRDQLAREWEGQGKRFYVSEVGLLPGDLHNGR